MGQGGLYWIRTGQDKTGSESGRLVRVCRCGTGTSTTRVVFRRSP